jgi:hypothetical protein
MWKKPNESLDDFIVKPVAEVDSEAPRSVSLRRTGEVEVLKPLARVDVRAKSGRYGFRPVYQPLWFRRFLAVGSGALVMIAFVLVSAILVGINETAGPEVASNDKIEYALAQFDEPLTFDISSFGAAVDAAQSYVRRRTARPTIQVAVNKPRPQLREPLQPDEPDFVPTTLVIYAENGSINTRIEPWFQTADKKTSSFNN